MIIISDSTHDTIIDNLRYWLGRIDDRDPDFRRLLAEKNCFIVNIAEYDRLSRAVELLKPLVDSDAWRELPRR